MTGQQNKPVRLPIWQKVLVVVLIAAFIPLTYFQQHIFSSYEAEITVNQVAAARSCRSPSSRRFSFQEPFRSEEQPIGLEYCGVVLTDHGNLTLPDRSESLPI